MTRPPKPTPPPAKPPRTLTVTPEQVAGIATRRSQVVAAQRSLTDYIEGVTAGHGITNARVVSVDDETMQLTLAE